MDKKEEVKYEPNIIEPKWQKYWEERRVYSPDLDSAKRPYYNLMMFPYPSAEGLHVGNMYAFTGADVYGRFQRMCGNVVFEPIGLDGFGIHSENYALKIGVHPMEQAEKSEKNFYRQLRAIGNSYDFTRTVETYKPDYYKWTQWVFTQMFKNGLAYRKKAQVNWCPSCKTVLSDEQVVQKSEIRNPKSETNSKSEIQNTKQTEEKVAVCERCETPVEKRDLEQWFFRITEYAERLLNNLDKLDWTEKVKIAQRNWIGRSEGARVIFKIKSQKSKGKSEIQKLKFDAKLIPLIISGQKQVTYRLEPKGFKEGDVVKFINKETKETFTTARITKIEEKKLKDIREDEPGHEKYDSREKMYKTYEKYYGNKVNDETKVWVYTFKILHSPSAVQNDNMYIEVFTTRPDTLYGATFLVLSPENPLINEISNFQFPISNFKYDEVRKYVEEAKKKTDQSSYAKATADKGKTGLPSEALAKEGVFTGLYAVNPVNNEEIPIWVADYVLMGYGTGAIMAVPAHDQRDYEFAIKYNLPIKNVIEPVLGKEADNEEFRKSIVAIVRNPKDNTYLSINWGEGKGEYCFIGGGLGIEENPIETAKREIREETGYKNVRLVAESELIHHHYFSHTKNINRAIDVIGYLYELVDDEKEEQHLEDYEKNKFTVEWITKEKAEVSVIDPMHKYLFNKFVNSQVYAGEGVIVNSGDWNGRTYPEGKEMVIKSLEGKGIGEKEVNYHLRDWLISRQRYWGPPIPMIYCEKCGVEGKSWFTVLVSKSHGNEISNFKFLISNENKKFKIKNSAEWDSAGWYPVPDKDLPVLLPKVDDYKPLGTGKAPLANHPDFYETTCPECGFPARRETDVSDTFLDSAWYFFRYLGTEFDNIPFPSEKFEDVTLSETKDSQRFSMPSGDSSSRQVRVQNDNDKGNSKQFRISDFDIRILARSARWMPVHMYIGGAEHSVLHLLYSRFMTMFFHDLGYIDFEEPYSRFYAHGLLIKEGHKMSKSKGNVVVPDEYISKYGSDTLRMYLMFLGPFSQGGDFYDSGIEGMHRFVKRVWTLFTEHTELKTPNHSLRSGTGQARNNTENSALVQRSVPRDSALVFMHKTIKRVTEDIESLRYNTAISGLMEWYNFLNEKLKISSFAEASKDKQNEKLTEGEVVTFLKLLAPFAPHMTEELWHRLELGIRNQESGRKEKNHNSLFMIHDSIHLQPWPSYDEKYLVEDQVTVVIQVNGKRRGELSINNDQLSNKEIVEKYAREKVAKYLEGMEIKKVVYVQGKIINFVV